MNFLREFSHVRLLLCAGRYLKDVVSMLTETIRRMALVVSIAFILSYSYGGIIN